MRRVCVSVEPSGFCAVQRYMEPLSSAGTRSSTSSFPSLSLLPSSRRPPTRVQVNSGSGNTSFCKTVSACECVWGRKMRSTLDANAENPFQIKSNLRDEASHNINNINPFSLCYSNWINHCFNAVSPLFFSQHIPVSAVFLLLTQLLFNNSINNRDTSQQRKWERVGVIITLFSILVNCRDKEKWSFCIRHKVHESPHYK